MAKDDTPDISPEVQAKIDFVRSVVPRHKYGSLIKSALIVFGVLIVALVVWLVVGGSGQSSPKPKVAKVRVPQVTALSATATNASYTSKYFSLNLKYPNSWSLKDSGAGLLTITSPLTKLVAAGGQSVNGKVTFTVAKQGTLPSGLTTGTSLAVLDSSVVTYSNPAADQSGQTYISFAQYSTTSTVGGLDGVYVTGNFGYQKDGVISASDINSANPLVYTTFTECTSTQCKTLSPLTIASASWAASPLSQIITSIIESFVFS